MLCRTTITREDGSKVTCDKEVALGKMECYLHSKYFTKVKLFGGKEVWQSSPSYLDRLRFSDRGKIHNCIVNIFSPNSRIERVIGDEYHD